MMNKSIIAIALMMSTTIAFAGKTSSQGNSDGGGAPVLLSEYPRVLNFDGAHNSISVDGQLLVCGPQFKAAWNANTCTDTNGANAWSLATDALPGFRLKAYDIRFAGSGGYRTLVLYFGAK